MAFPVIAGFENIKNIFSTLCRIFKRYPDEDDTCGRTAIIPYNKLPKILVMGQDDSVFPAGKPHDIKVRTAGCPHSYLHNIISRIRQ